MVFIKWFFDIFDIAILSKNDLEQKRAELLKKLDQSELEEKQHIIDVQENNKTAIIVENKKAIDPYITERPMFVKGEIAAINNIMHEFDLIERVGGTLWEC